MTQGPVVRDRKDVGDADDVVLTVHAYTDACGGADGGGKLGVCTHDCEFG
jgi:hypothetical protein